MSKIFKSSDIRIDENNRVDIRINGKNKKVEDKIKDNLKSDEISEKGNNILESANNKAKIIEENAVKKAKSEAESIIENSKIEGDKIINSSKEEANKIKEDAYNDGYSQGFRKGEEEVELIKKEAEKLIIEADKYKDELIEDLEPEIIELILDLVVKLLSDEVEINPDVVGILIRKGLNEAAVTGDISIHVSKEDYEYVEDNRNEILAGVETMAKITIDEDLSLSKSECIIETEFGNINANLDEQFKELKKSMYYLLNTR